MKKSWLFILLLAFSVGPLHAAICSAPIVLRSEKGSQLSTAEGDSNFTQVRLMCDEADGWLTTTTGDGRYSLLGHTHTASEVTDFVTATQTVGDARYSLLAHTHTASQVTNFTTAVQAVGDARYSLLAHTHVAADITDFSTALRAITDPLYATASHTHVAADITDFSTALEAVGDPRYAALIHAHAVADITSGTFDPARLPTATTSTQGAVVLATTSSDVTAGHAVQASDARMSNARTPTSTLAHASTHAAAGSDPVTIANTQVTGLGTASTRNVAASGNAASSEVVKGDDGRLTDTRTPSSTLAHASTHASGGSDPVALSPSQITGTGSASKCARFDSSHQLIEASGDCASGDTTLAVPGSGTELMARSSSTAMAVVTGSSTANGGLGLVNQSASAIPFSVTAAASQSGNLMNVTSNAGTAGDLFKLSSAGYPTFAGSYAFANATGFEGGSNMLLTNASGGNSNSQGLIARRLVLTDGSNHSILTQSGGGPAFMDASGANYIGAAMNATSWRVQGGTGLTNRMLYAGANQEGFYGATGMCYQWSSSATEAYSASPATRMCRSADGVVSFDTTVIGNALGVVKAATITAGTYNTTSGNLVLAPASGTVIVPNNGTIGTASAFANLDISSGSINIDPQGSTKFQFVAGSNGRLSSNGTDPNIVLGTGGYFGFTNGTGNGGTVDTGISRDAAGVVDIGTGAAGNAAGTLKAAAVALNGKSPSTITGLTLWLRPGVGAYSDAGVTPATNTGTVQQWNDQSGNGNNVTQATAGKRFTYVTNAQNGLAVMRLAGGQCLASPSISTGTFLLLVVHRLTGTAGIIAEQGPNANSSDGFFLYGASPQAKVRHSGSPGEVGAPVTSWAEVGQWMVSGMLFSSPGNFSDIRLIRDHFADVGAVSITDPGTVAANDVIYVGGRACTNVFSTGDIGEVVLVSPAPSFSDTTAVINWLKNEWSIP